MVRTREAIISGPDKDQQTIYISRSALDRSARHNFQYTGKYPLRILLRHPANSPQYVLPRKSVDSVAYFCLRNITIRTNCLGRPAGYARTLQSCAIADTTVS
jgi:hypothetical protein